MDRYAERRTCVGASESCASELGEEGNRLREGEACGICDRGRLPQGDAHVRDGCLRSVCGIGEKIGHIDCLLPIECECIERGRGELCRVGESNLRSYCKLENTTRARERVLHAESGLRQLKEGSGCICSGDTGQRQITTKLLRGITDALHLIGGRSGGNSEHIERGL